MKTGRSGPRSQNGCWTCRGRKVKCEESRPLCKNCADRGLECDYAPRLKPQRRRRRAGNSREALTEAEASPSQTSQYPSLTSVQLSPGTTPPILLSSPCLAKELPLELPNGICIQDWPIPLSAIDCQALRHYAQDFISRMVLRTPKWSSYTFVLFLCSKHALLAHLVLAFSVRDMANDDSGPLHIIAIEHYRTALALFIQLLGASEQHLWLAFPALWLFIHYEQQYGDDPRALQRHLVGVRDVVASLGTALFLTLDGEFSTMEMAGIARPRQIVDRLALRAIYHDASAATFGFSGGLIQLLNEHYPGSIAKIRESSRGMIGAAWGEIYPIEEKLWDVQLSPMEDLYHECHLLRYELSRVGEGDSDFDKERLVDIGRELKRLEKEHLPLLEATLSCRMERNTIQSNNYAGAAIYFALVIIYERKVYSTRPTVAISKTLRACSKLYEHEGAGYLWRIAWPMFVAGLETDDLIYQAWVIERFTSIQSLGENLRRAKILLESICAEQRKTGQQIDFLSRIREGHFQGFVI